MEEPSVLDYVKSLLMPWKGQRIHIPAPRVEETPPAPTEFRPKAVDVEEGEISQAPQAIVKPAETAPAYALPWRSLLALVLALMAQAGLEPPGRNAALALVLYGFAAVLLVWALLAQEWSTPDLGEDNSEPMALKVRRPVLLFAIPLTVLAYIAFGGGLFTLPNLVLGLITFGYVVVGFYQYGPARESPGWWRRLPDFSKFRIQISPWMVLVALVFVLALFFRFYRLSEVPGEMFSDHAEKLLDVTDVLDGQTSIFFPRNTGREAIQFYLTAAIAELLQTGISFLSLKLGTALLGFLTLPFIYLLGKEIGGKWVGLLALLLAAIGYWPNTIARIGLRFPLYPFFVAPALYFLIRGLRRQNRNDFIWSGIALGLGLHGYSPMRIVPFVFVFLVLLYLLHRQANGKRIPVLAAFAILGIIAFILLLPLARYALESPQHMEYVGLRAFSRIGTTETQYPAAPLRIFLDNLWRTWVMPFWDDGEIWVHSVTGRPSLDLVSAALYFLGSLVVLVRYIRRRHWIDLFLLVSVPLFMLPSILSLAFPNETPSLNRTGAAYIPIFILAAIGLEGLLKTVRGKTGSRFGFGLAVVVAVLLIGRSVAQNYDLVFRQFDQQFMRGAWNTSQIGGVIRGFADSVGDAEHAYVIPYPHWVDTRLVGMNAGYPRKDYALQRDDIAKTMGAESAKLFIFKPEDSETMQILQQLYPQGAYSIQASPYEGKDFVVYMVPAAAGSIR